MRILLDAQALSMYRREDTCKNQNLGGASCQNLHNSAPVLKII